MSLATEDREQLRAFDALIKDRDDELEFSVRSVAEYAAENPQTYTQGLRIPWNNFPVSVDYVDPQGMTQWCTIFVRLTPALESHPKAAALVAERIIHEQLAAFRGEKWSSDEVHRLSHPEWTESEEHMGSWKHEKIYELRARIDDTFITGRYTLPNVLADRYSGGDESGIMKSIRARLQHQFLRELGRHLGFEDA